MEPNIHRNVDGEVAYATNPIKGFANGYIQSLALTLAPKYGNINVT